MGATRRGGVLPAVAVALTGCSADSVPSFLLFPDVPSETVEIRTVTAGDRGPVWEVGPPIPLDGIGQIFAARLWGDGVVGIVDAMACQVVLLELAGDEVRSLARFGRCGEGPGEFRGVTDVFLDEDSLVVLDHEENSLTFFPLSGGEPRTLRIEPAWDDPWRAVEVLHADEESVLLIGTLAPGADPEAGLIRRLERETGDPLHMLVPDAPAAALNRAPVLRRVFACRHPESGRLTVANRWRMERAILDEEGRSPGEDHPAAMGVVGRFEDAWLAYSNRSPLGPVLRRVRLLK